VNVNFLWGAFSFLTIVLLLIFDVHPRSLPRLITVLAVHSVWPNSNQISGGFS